MGPPANRTLVYTISGDADADSGTRLRRALRWKVAAGVGTGLVAVGVVVAVLVSGGGAGTPTTERQPSSAATVPSAPTTPDAADIGLSVTGVNDLGDRVELTWSAEGDLDFSVVVAGENIRTMVLVANRQRTMTVPVDRARKYCFQIRATDSREIYSSEPVPIRGARCAL